MYAICVLILLALILMADVPQRCPSCESKLVKVEAGYHVCTNCTAVVDYERGTWRLALEWRSRPLPGWVNLRKRKGAA